VTVRSRDERGAVVVVAIAMIGVLVVLAATCAGAVAIVLAHRRAQVAADLAVLAGASALQQGGDACASVVRIAGRHGARVTRCAVDGFSVTASTAVDLPAVLGGGQVPARARAGPAPAMPDDLHVTGLRPGGTSTACAQSC
jgi:secretion/DNA translocation related TadE-like protein